MHIDPLGTSAWNTVVSGRKLWVLFPPHVNKNIAKGKDVLKHGEDDEPVRNKIVARFSLNEVWENYRSLQLGPGCTQRQAKHRTASKVLH